MQFLLDTDFNVQLRNEVSQVLKISDTSLPNAEGMAQSQMIGYLRTAGYDVDAIFSATDSNRSPIIIMYLIDMTVYHLHSNTALRAMPQIRHDRYHAAIDWLGKVARKELNPDLPVVQTDDPTPTFKFSSCDKYFKRW